jgi:hypothetical protein
VGVQAVSLSPMSLKPGADAPTPDLSPQGGEEIKRRLATMNLAPSRARRSLRPIPDFTLKSHGKAWGRST